MTLPKASGAVWIWVPTSSADSGVKPSLSTMSGTAMKHSWMARSASLAYLLNHWLGFLAQTAENMQ